MQAFVAMPFNPKFLSVWKAIKDACQSNGIEACRVDQLPQVDDIHKAIFDEIAKSDLVIVDFSGEKVANGMSVPNPNVVSEAMYARTQKKALVLLCQTAESLPFDWRTHRAVVYENSPAGLEYLAEVLRENLAGMKKRLAKISIHGNQAQGEVKRLYRGREPMGFVDSFKKGKTFGTQD